MSLGSCESGRKKQPEDKVFGQEIPGRRGPSCWDIPDPGPGDVPNKSFLQGALFCCLRQGIAGMSHDLGRDVPGSDSSEGLYARNIGLIFVP